MAGRAIRLLFFMLVHFSVVKAQQSFVWELIRQGNYLQVVSEIESVSPTDNYEMLELKAHALHRSYQVEAYQQAIRKAYSADNDKVRAEILLSLKTADYYQLVLRSDSTLYFAHQGMRLFRERGGYLPDSLKCYIYSSYANNVRNWRGPNEHLGKRWPLAERNTYLRAYLDTAMQFAVNDEQRADVYMILGTLHTDGLTRYEHERSQEYVECSARSIFYLQKAIELLLSPTRIAHAYALIGLNHNYMFEHGQADASYQQALKWLEKDSIIQSHEEFLTACNWRGTNLELWFAQSGKFNQLELADSMYRISIPSWQKLLSMAGNNGVNDGYRISPLNKMAAINYRLYKETGVPTYFEKVFEYADAAKYPTHGAQTVTLPQLQQFLDDSTAFIHWTITARPKLNLVFVILKDTVIVMETVPARCHTKEADKMSGHTGFTDFKSWSFESYQRYFMLVDSVLQRNGITRLVASHCDECATLNLDVLVSDTVADSWKNLPYLYKRYKITYALSARSYVNSHATGQHKGIATMGITIGDYEQRADLRFSKKMADRLEQVYAVRRSDVTKTLLENSVALLLSHGEGNMNQRKSALLLEDDRILSADDIFGLPLKNDLVLVTACNTNSSASYKSEGAAGNFSKALRYAGSKSSMTTSWEIDEETNAYITEQFIHHLALGHDKSTALWCAKNDYWKQEHADDEHYRPMYWAPYILTGNILPVVIPQQGTFPIWPLGMSVGGMVFLAGLLFIRKHRFRE